MLKNSNQETEDFKTRLTIIETRVDDLNSQIKNILTVVSIAVISITIIVSAVGFFITSQTNKARELYNEAVDELSKRPNLIVYSGAELLEGKVFTFSLYPKQNSFKIKNILIKNIGNKASNRLRMRLYLSKKVEVERWQELSSEDEKYKVLFFSNYNKINIMPKEIWHFGDLIFNIRHKRDMLIYAKLLVFYEAEAPTIIKFTISIKTK